jgi:hypothetical protein
MKRLPNKVVVFGCKNLQELNTSRHALWFALKLINSRAIKQFKRLVQVSDVILLYSKYDCIISVITEAFTCAREYYNKDEQVTFCKGVDTYN